MKLIKLNCPNCGGPLELPDNLTVAHCLYCGNKILLDQDGVVQDHRDIERYKELLKVAFDAQNHNDVIRYCSLILEIDPKDIESWLRRAISTFYSGTADYDRYNESLEYLNKAAQIAPDDQRIGNIRKELTRREVAWLISLAEHEMEIATRLYNGGPTEALAREGSNDYTIKTMNYLLAASDLAPDNFGILGDIETIVKRVGWIDWSEKVHSKLNTLSSLRAMKEAKANLPDLKAELAKAKQDLATLQTQKGLFVGGKIKDAERRDLKTRAIACNSVKFARLIVRNENRLKSAVFLFREIKSTRPGQIRPKGVQLNALTFLA